jgi:DhnA family fructose-bisphosphate aldolase class Ia
LGADVVNVYGAADPSVIEQVKTWCPAEVIAQGAPSGQRTEVLANWAEKCLAAGADGVCVGRAVWGAPHPREAFQAINEAVRGSAGRGDDRV